MLNILVTAENNKEGLQELREFDNFLNSSFIVKYKSSVNFNQFYNNIGRYLRTNRTNINRVFNDNILLQAVTSTMFAVPIQDATFGQQQSNIIHQANAFQGVNLIYAVDTK